MYDELVEGRMLAGKYRVERVLGQGGMGIVVAAHHLQLDARVALKLMHRDALLDAEAVARFSREARAAVRIKSEHVARVSDVGVLEGGAPYMVMEYLDGEDLSARLTHAGRLPTEEAVELVLQACEAIAEAHTLGIVHRDLKPANLFLIRRPDGTASIKVLDFGLSKLTGLTPSAPDFGMTKTADIMGSPYYMSPEQMRGGRLADERTDIWALGVILYELLSGGRPFVAHQFTELVLKIATEEPVPLLSLVPDLPPGLDAAISRCLQKDPSKRFATIQELAQALVGYGPPRAKLSLERIFGVMKAAGISTNPPAAPLKAASESLGDTAKAASWGQTSPGRAGGKPALIGSAIALGVAALMVAAYVVKVNDGGRSEEPGTAAATPPLAAIDSAPQVVRVAEAPATTTQAPSMPPEAAVSAGPRAAGSGSASRAVLPKPAELAAAKPAAPPRAGVAAAKPSPSRKNANSVFDER